MPSFLHLPSQRVVETDNHSQSARYRRSHRFIELTDTDTVSPIKNVMSSYPTQSPTDPLPDSSSSPQSPPDPQPIKPSPLESDRPKPPESPQIPTDAPETPAPSFDDLTTTDASNLTVSQVLAWVADNPQRARQALDAEKQGRNRVTLTSKLRRIH